MTTAAEHIHERARQLSPRRRVVLAEGDDPRVQQAAAWATERGIADVMLLGTTTATVPGSYLRVLRPQDHPDFQKLCDAYCAGREEANQRKVAKAENKNGISDATTTTISKEATAAAAVASLAEDDRTDAASPLFFANLLVRDGQQDGSVAGAVNPSGRVVSSALRCLGLSEGVDTLSSFFVMDFTARDRAMIFSDCAVVVSPSPEQLAEIALASAESAATFLPQQQQQLGEETNEPVKVALLSFSTKGSSQAPEASKPAEALEIVLAKQQQQQQQQGAAGVNAVFDGALQLDAACVPAVADAKAPGSPVGGDADVFVFPGLEAGNIGYKLAERFGGATAIGPILQGLRQPANDLSRGCTPEDILDVIAVTALQAADSAAAVVHGDDDADDDSAGHELLVAAVP